MPALKETTAFTLGILAASGRLLDDSALSLLSRLPKLRTLKFSYQMTLNPRSLYRFQHLRSLTVVIHRDPDTTATAVALYSFVCRLVRHTRLESLVLSPAYTRVDRRRCSSPNVNPLLSSLSARHAPRLRVLKIPSFYVGRAALKDFCCACARLEELAVTVSRDTLNDFWSYATDTVHRLRSVELWVANSRSPVVVSQDFAERLLNESTDVRSVMVDGRRFQGTRVRGTDGTLQLVWRSSRLGNYSLDGFRLCAFDICTNGIDTTCLS
ncbi:hypothetical protein C8Q76DRAFT_697485 [Earliella scabrosa]|nr:hypothetical protein C8Q76DRAFT_697485 [Earliella scabrosa]